MRRREEPIGDGNRVGLPIVALGRPTKDEPLKKGGEEGDYYEGIYIQISSQDVQDACNVLPR